MKRKWLCLILAILSAAMLCGCGNAEIDGDAEAAAADQSESPEGASSDHGSAVQTDTEHMTESETQTGSGTSADNDSEDGFPVDVDDANKNAGITDEGLSPSDVASEGEVNIDFYSPFARVPAESDWTNINPDFPAELYKWAYNCGDVSIRDGLGNVFFETNTGAHRSMSEDQIAEIVQAGTGFFETLESADCTGDLERQMQDMLYYENPYSSSDEEEGFVYDQIQLIHDYELVKTAYYMTDDSLVYVSSSGMAVSRGRCFVRFDFANDTYLESINPVELGKWYYTDCEVAFAHPESDIGMEPKWDTGYYTAESNWFFTYLTEATDADMAMLEKYLESRGISDALAA